MSFPSNPNDNDIFERFGRKLRYKASKGVWDVISSPTVAPIQEAAPTTSSVAQAVNLPMVGNEIGAMSYVQESNRLYVWNGSGWFEIALVNTNPTITDGGQASYTLNTDGTPTVITLTANDPEGVPLAWSYTASSGSLGGTTVTNVDNVFTITPSTNSADAGSFSLTFTASDGVNVDTSVSTFSLSFVPDWTAASFLASVGPYTVESYENPTNYNFGSALSISGDYLAVSAYRERLSTGYDSGAVHIISASTGALISSIPNPSPYDGTYNDWFGEVISLDGNCLVVGSPRDDKAGVTNAGRAFIFKTVSGDWTDTTLAHTIENPASGTSFGWSVALAGDVVVIGQPDYNGSRGRVYVYSASTGTLQYTIENPNAYAGSQVADQFGKKIATDGSKIVVGTPNEDSSPTAFDQGKVYVFNASSGALIWTLNNPSPQNSGESFRYDYFGNTVAISDGYIAVAATNEDDGLYDDNCGYVYVYNSNTGSLVYSIKDPNLIEPTYFADYFGRSIDISGEYMIVGSNERASNGTQNVGAIWIFEVSTGNLLFYTGNPTGNANEGFGATVAISGFYAFAGLTRPGSDMGRVDIFRAG